MSEKAKFVVPLDVLRAAIPFASEDPARVNLRTVCLRRLEPGRTAVVATNGHILARWGVDDPTGAAEVGDSLSVGIDAIRDYVAMISAEIERRRAALNRDSRVFAAAYFDLMESGNPSLILGDDQKSVERLEAVERAGVSFSAREEGAATITARHPLAEASMAVCDIEFPDENFVLEPQGAAPAAWSAVLNPRYLATIFGAVGAARVVQIGFPDDARRPIQVRSGPNNSVAAESRRSVEACIMPMAPSAMYEDLRTPLVGRGRH